MDQQLQYGTAKSEPARVGCQVDANPSDVTFRWQFNSSTETLDLPFSQVRLQRCLTCCCSTGSERLNRLGSEGRQRASFSLTRDVERVVL